VAKKPDPGTEHITGLLAERGRLTHWLERLDLNRDKAKSDVAGKVRADYERRLAEVNEELTQYGDGLRQKRENHARNLTGLRKQESDRSEEMSEAELRHAVGEYDESEWNRKQSGIRDKLNKIRESIAEEEAALESLDEILASLTADPEPVEDDDAEDEEDEEEALAPPPPPPSGKKKKKRQQQEQQPKLGDELEFLKSVTEDDQGGPSAKRASGQLEAIPDDEDEADDEPPKQQVVGKSRPSVVNQRTLKCEECGALNLPTEWYCEKCGAELAAV
jgi:chromosome segregation ATPase